MSAKPAWSGRQTGAVVLELALVALLLFMLLVGTVEFGGLMYTSMAVVSAAHAGAQYGAQSVTNSADLAGIEQAARDDANSLPGFTASALRRCQCSAGGSVDCRVTCAGGEQPSIYVEITTRARNNSVIVYTGLPLLSTVRAKAVMRAR